MLFRSYTETTRSLKRAGQNRKKKTKKTKTGTIEKYCEYPFSQGISKGLGWAFLCCRLFRVPEPEQQFACMHSALLKTKVSIISLEATSTANGTQNDMKMCAHNSLVFLKGPFPKKNPEQPNKFF